MLLRLATHHLGSMKYSHWTETPGASSTPILLGRHEQVKPVEAASASGGAKEGAFEAVDVVASKLRLP